MLAVHPLTAERWEDFELLFGPNGATSGCWCMWWRITAAEFAAEAGDGLRAKFKSLVSDEHHPGLLAYWEGVPAGWVSLGDRSEFGRLNRSPKLGPIDDERVASIVCFFVRARSDARAFASPSSTRLWIMPEGPASSSSRHTRSTPPDSNGSLPNCSPERSISSWRQGSMRWHGVGAVPS